MISIMGFMLYFDGTCNCYWLLYNEWMWLKCLFYFAIRFLLVRYFVIQTPSPNSLFVYTYLITPWQYRSLPRTRLLIRRTQSFKKILTRRFQSWVNIGMKTLFVCMNIFIRRDIFILSFNSALEEIWVNLLRNEVSHSSTTSLETRIQLIVTCRSTGWSDSL